MKMGNLVVTQESLDAEIVLETVNIDEVTADELEKMLENEF